MTARNTKTQRIAIVGLGAVGRELARRITRDLPGYELVAVSAKDHDKANKFLLDEGIHVPVVRIEDIEPLCDIVIECAPPALLTSIVEPMVHAGKEAVVLSVGMLLEHPKLLEIAEQTGARISVPTGALLGLDAVAAAAEGVIHSVRITSSKPTKGLVDAPYLIEMGIDANDLSEPTQVFAGTAREAVKGFPSNLNVTVALALAGVGPDETYVDVWVDPTISRNTHVVSVDSDAARLTMKIENIPSANPRTGLITALSVIALLRKRNAVLVVGS